MAKKIKIDAKDLELMKDWFSKPEENKEEIHKSAPKIRKKPRFTAPVRSYFDQTGEEAYDSFGEKTPNYEEWYQTEWPEIKAMKAKTKEITTTTTTITKKVTTERVDLTLLIEENVKALKDITFYLRSMDNSLQNLTKGPVKVEIVK